MIIWHKKDLNTQCPPEVIVHLADFTRHWTDKVYVGQVILCQVVKKDKGAVTLKCDPGRKQRSDKTELHPMHEKERKVNYNE